MAYSYTEKKRLKASYDDGETFTFLVTSFNDDNGLPSWTISPEHMGDRKITEATQLSIVE